MFRPITIVHFNTFDLTFNLTWPSFKRKLNEIARLYYIGFNPR